MNRRPGISLRLKLAASYAAFVVIVGIAIFAIGFLVLRFVPDSYAYGNDSSLFPSRSDLLEVFVRYSAWTLVGLALVGVVGGWLLAGWMLRPLRRIGDVVAHTRGGAFGDRIRLAGRRDELTDLADAFDGMLDRVQRTVDAERRFAANASHELRTPLAVTRTLLDVARADPSRDVDKLLERLSATNDRSIALTEGALALARVDREALDRSPVDLAAAVDLAIDDVDHDATHRGIRISTVRGPAAVSAHPALVSQLVGNLVRNAVVHNVDGGAVWASVATADGWARLTVENTGPVLDPATVATLTEPYVRAGGRLRQDGHPTGAGLGLAIARAVVEAHAGGLLVTGRPDGGLRVTAMLPAA